MLGAGNGQILWLALGVPLLVLVQAGLLLMRNRVRDRIHGSPASEPDLESAVRIALDAVFDEAAARFDDSLDQPAFRAYLTGLADEVAERTEATVALTPSERQVMRAALVDAVLEAFAVTDSAR